MRRTPPEPPEPDVHCWYCGEGLFKNYRGLINALRGYACCMSEECIDAIVLEVGLETDYEQWKKSEFGHGGMTLASYAVEEVRKIKPENAIGKFN